MNAVSCYPWEASSSLVHSVKPDNAVPGVDFNARAVYLAGPQGSREADAPHIAGCCCYGCLGMDQYLMQLIRRVKHAESKCPV